MMADKSGDKLDIAFIVLNYLAVNKTLHCVLNITNTMLSGTINRKFRVIVVDNFSTKSVLGELKQGLQNISNVDLVQLAENKGFAQGNNAGIKFAREHYDARYVCCLNSDVEFFHQDIVRILDDEWKESHFSVAGPLILSGNGDFESNPQRYNIIDSVSDVDMQIRRYQRIEWIFRHHFGRFYHFFRLFRLFRNATRNTRANSQPRREYNVQLSGACWFFSETFFLTFSGLFPGTFLYKEEDILRYQLKEAGLTSVFLPDIFVYHEEDASSSLMKSTYRTSQIELYRRYIESLRAFKLLMLSNKR